MKTLASPQDKQEVLERLAKVRADSPRVWGKMSAPQMICHLSDSFCLAFGERQASPVDNLFSRTIMKWFALSVPLPWPHGIQTRPEVDQQVHGTPPGEFVKDRQEFVSITERFVGQSDRFGGVRHPIFGTMTTGEWLRWGYLHLDHHLRQFGC